MFYVDNPTGVPVMPPVAAELSKTTLYFTEGGNGIPPTYPGPDWFNIIQSELLEILRQANIKPDKNTTDQIMTALKKLFITNSGSAGAIAGLTGQNNTFPYFTGKDTMALTPLSAFVRGILGKNSASDFVKDIGAGRAFSGSVSIGGDSGAWTTAQFIDWLDSQGAFNHSYWMCKGSWAYAGNKIITDTGCGNIQLAGAVVEVMGVKSAMTIRVTTPTTATNGTTSSQFTYINHGDAYSPGWRREYNTRNKPTASDVGHSPQTVMRSQQPDSRLPAGLTMCCLMAPAISPSTPPSPALCVISSTPMRCFTTRAVPQLPGGFAHLLAASCQAFMFRIREKIQQTISVVCITNRLRFISMAHGALYPVN